VASLKSPFSHFESTGGMAVEKADPKRVSAPPPLTVGIITDVEYFIPVDGLKFIVSLVTRIPNRTSWFASKSNLELAVKVKVI
jgi:hypothetical protein